MQRTTPAARPDLYVAALSGWPRDCVETLRAAVRGAAGLNERINWGHLVYLADGPALLIRAEDERVLLGVWRGQRLLEIEPRLKPGGKYEMATFAIHQGDVVDPAAARFDAVLTGRAGADVFELGNAAGRLNNLGGLTITDFRPGLDKMIIYAGEPEEYDSFAEIMARATQVGRDVVFDFFPASTKDLPSLGLEKLRLSALGPDDFLAGG